MHSMVLLGDEAQVDACFILLGDGANLDARYVHGFALNILQAQKIILDTPDRTPR
jgi:hypothetical protein